MKNMLEINFKKPDGFRERVDVPEDTKVLWLYWTPAGDELMRGYITADSELTLYTESDIYWPLWFELRKRNPHINFNRFGSSDHEGKYCLLFIEDKTYVIEKAQLYEQVEQLLKLA